MKVLQINCVYKKGSTGKIVYDINNCLKSRGIESVVCYGRGAKIHELGVYKFCSELESKVYHLLNKLGWLEYSVCQVATARLIRIIKKERPDVVHIHCINGYCVDIYRLLNYLGRAKLKTVITHHSEFFYTGNCGSAYDCMKFQDESGCYNCPRSCYATGALFLDRTRESWRKMKKAFSYFEKEKLMFTAVSPWVVNRSLLSPICNQFPCICVKNGLDTQVFKPAAEGDIQSVRSRIPNNSRRIILHVTASFTTDENSLKGGIHIKHLAEMMPSYEFVVVASYIGDVGDLPQNVFVWGRTNSQTELATLYSIADVTVIASRQETFSMVVAESLCCGTPVVGFKAGGPESIAIEEYTSFVRYGDEKQLKANVALFAESNMDAAVIADQAAVVYSKEKMANNYVNIYIGM